MDDDSVICQNCHHRVLPVKVAGHTQCPHCTRVMDECCSGESVGIAAEADGRAAHVHQALRGSR